MQTFLAICEELGLRQRSLNRQRLLASIPVGFDDAVLFLICGYDFAYHPNERKFAGIGELFVRRNSPYQLNLGAKCVTNFFSMQSNPGIGVSVEGTSWPTKPGKAPLPGLQVSLDPAQMRQAAGVRVGGVGNYNLQTKALDMLLTDAADGLDRQGMLTGGRDEEGGDGRNFTWPRLKAVCLGPSVTASAISAAYLEEMTANVRPYWGGDTVNLGL